MSFVSRLLGVLALSLVSLTVACDEEKDEKSRDGTMKSDGYALFSVDNPRQQRDDVTVIVSDVDPGATYVLIYSAGAPKNTGWFLFDPDSRDRCGGDTGPHCEIPDSYGHMVDKVTVPAGATSITLRDQRCGCDANRSNDDWTGHWAVMRVERTNRENKINFFVRAGKIDLFTDTPEISQLQ